MKKRSRRRWWKKEDGEKEKESRVVVLSKPSQQRQRGGRSKSSIHRPRECQPLEYRSFRQSFLDLVDFFALTTLEIDSLVRLPFDGKIYHAGAGFARVSVIAFATRHPMISLSLLSILSGTLAIRNDRTSSRSRSSQDDPVLSASSYAGPQRTTLSSDRHDESLTFQRTSPAFRLETSKSVYSYDNKNEIREYRSEEPIDQLTSSKHVDHIDGNNIEVKSGEYYR